jgi:hypothetical protein
VIAVEDQELRDEEDAPGRLCRGGRSRRRHRAQLRRRLVGPRARRYAGFLVLRRRARFVRIYSVAALRSSPPRYHRTDFGSDNPICIYLFFTLIIYLRYKHVTWVYMVRMALCE